MQYDDWTLYDAEMPYNGFVGGGSGGGSSGGGTRKRDDDSEWLNKYTWVTPYFMREYYGLAKQVERIQARPEPQALKVKESTKPYTKKVNNILQIDFEALFRDRQAKEVLEKNLAAFNFEMKMRAEAEKAAKLEQIRLKRQRNIEALILILAET